MVQQNLQIQPAVQEESRDLDPNVRQRRASDPESTVWVGASAGTGKTKVLTDRVLRLMLPRKDGHAGTKPHRILCLTFTKAGASEMSLRVNKILSEWAVKPEDKLTDDLQKLLGYEPSGQVKSAARRLFAAVVDTPGGLKIMTIHSFCQSVLSRFPLEAGLSPHFKVVEEGVARNLLLQARDDVLSRPAERLLLPLERIAAEQNEDQFNRLLSDVLSEREALSRCVDDTQIMVALGLPAGATKDGLLQDACTQCDEGSLREACRVLADGTEKTDQPRGLGIQVWLDMAVADRRKHYKDYELQYLKKEDAIRQTLVTKKLADASPHVKDALEREAERLLELRDQLKAIDVAVLTQDLMLIARAIHDRYAQLKKKQNVLDYDDLILTTKTLLQKTNAAPWVLYKLDGGLDHVLIDEAQDTNPEQWEIIDALCDDFYSGLAAQDDEVRTVFTVGDEKQSIYSFQRASPKEFFRMKDNFKAKTERAKQSWRDEKLNISFRSTKTVLRLVDDVFREEGFPPHKSFRRGQAGHAELWPLFTPDEAQDNEEPWTPPIAVRDVSSPQAQAADYIGQTIKGWLDSGEELISKGRAIVPGDIMVLVRTRSAFVNQLVRALKTRNVPVSGIDRMVLDEQLVVQDLLALAQFALLPSDDLTLACILKSPFVGWDEEQLFAVAHGRAGTLWQALQDGGHKAIVEWLRRVIYLAESSNPYEFFAGLLQRGCPADAVSGMRGIQARMGEEVLDPLDEFLNLALSYERENIPSLQGFLTWQQQDRREIKREMEEAGGHVRIMTVHGSKGLQAPIVILPDTVRTAGAKKTPRLLWPDKTNLDVPLWSPRKDYDCAAYREAQQSLDDYLDGEYRRLLYVAMTRAEDRLYVCGYRGQKEPIEESWYNQIAAAFGRIDDVREEDRDGMMIRIIDDPQTKDVKRDEVEAAAGHDLPLPAFVFARAPAEPQPPRPLMPSRPSAGDMEPPVQSPLRASQDHRFLRGNVTHSLLQFLPDIPVDRRRAAADQFVQQPGHGLNENMQQSIVQETMAILENPAYAPLFGPGSQAEVPITGLVNGRLISGQIDRLLVTENDIWIVDYKSNRPSPDDPADVPAVYRAQLQSYRDTLTKIYPDRVIKCFLLWTDGPKLMEVSI